MKKKRCLALENHLFVTWQHLYDLVQLMDTSHGQQAVQDHSLFASIIQHRRKFAKEKGVDYGIPRFYTGGSKTAAAMSKVKHSCQVEWDEQEMQWLPAYLEQTDGPPVLQDVLYKAFLDESSLSGNRQTGFAQSRIKHKLYKALFGFPNCKN